jgi:hypothetical protein
MSHKAQPENRHPDDDREHQTAPIDWQTKRVKETDLKAKREIATGYERPENVECR